MRDLVANTTILVSRRVGGQRGRGERRLLHPGDLRATATGSPSRSRANNLSNEDDDGFANVFVRDLAAATTTLVSRATGAGGAPASGGASNSPAISPSGRFVAFMSGADNLSADDDNAVTNIFLRDLDESTTALASRANGARGAGADAIAPVPRRLGQRPRGLHLHRDQPLGRGQRPFEDVFVRDVLADTTELVSRAPGAGRRGGQRVLRRPHDLGRRPLRGVPVAREQPGRRDRPGRRQHLPPRRAGRRPGGHAGLQDPAPAAGARPTRTTSPSRSRCSQLRINQRISQAAIRRLNAVEARLNGGLQARDLCGYSVGPPQLGPGITSAPAAASLAPAAPADPATIVDPGRSGPGDPLTLSAAQLLINQRIDQAAIRRATGITNRLEAGLTGGDVRAGQVTQGKLFDRLQILAKAPAAEPPATKTTIPPRKNPPDPGSVTLSTAQLRINQRIAQAGVRNANALIRRLETGLSGADLRPGP